MLALFSVINLASSLKEKDHYSWSDNVKRGEEGPGERKRNLAWQVKPREAQGGGAGRGWGVGGRQGLWGRGGKIP